MTMLLPAVHAREIELHGESAYPEEGAGLLLGSIEDGGLRRVHRSLPLPNRWEDEARVRRYRIDPIDLLDAEETAEQDGLTILGIYHSHPDHPARPSAFDLERALPFYTYLITEVRSAAAVENRAWRLAEDRGSFEEESLTVVADQKEDR